MRKISTFNCLVLTCMICLTGRIVEAAETTETVTYNWEDINTSFGGESFDIGSSPDKLFVMADKLYEFNQDGTYVKSYSEIFDTGNLLWDFYPGVYVTSSGEAHVIARTEGNRLDGFKLNYSRVSSEGSIMVDNIQVGSPLKRNYAVDITVSESGKVIYGHSQGGDNVWGTVHFYEVDADGGTLLGSLTNEEYYRVDADFKMLSIGEKLHLMTGKPDNPGTVYYMQGNISTDLVTNLENDITAFTAGESRKTAASICSDNDGNIYSTYGAANQVYFNKYDSSGIHDISDHLLFDNLGDWHLNAGMSQIAVSSDSKYLVAIALDPSGTDEAAQHSELLWRYSTDGGITWSDTKKWDQTVHGGEARSIPKIAVIGYDFYIVYLKSDKTTKLKRLSFGTCQAIYNLNIIDGTGSGIYCQDGVVDIVANPAPDGQKFNGWTGDVSYVTDIDSANTTVTMPASNIELTASYVDIPTINLTVNSGTGTGIYMEGTVVDILAEPAPEGKQFAGWTGDITHIADADSMSTSVTIPDVDITLTATYEDIPKYTLNINNGTGSGNYEEGTIVEITANTPPDGQQFTNWTGDVSYVNHADSANTYVTMPPSTVNLTANFEDIPTFALVVNNGNGDGNYYEGTVVDISSDIAPQGKRFLSWTGDISYINEVNDSITTVTIPAEDIIVTANFEDIPRYDLTVINGLGTGSYVEGANINISADPASDGKKFAGWIGDIGYIDDEHNMDAIVTMPDIHISLTATYKNKLIHQLEVNNGNGSGDYMEGSVVNISADSAPEGKQFSTWSGDTSYLADARDPVTTVTIPDMDISVSAIYTDIPVYSLNVQQGTGSGNYEQGAVINISADMAPEGMRFTSWTGDTDYVKNIDSASTSVTMPAKEVNVAASYEDIPEFTLTVNNGTGSGIYKMGSLVEIVAQDAPEGKQFSGWFGDTDIVSNTDSAITTVLIPEKSVIITALYEDIPVFSLNVVNGSGDGDYEEGEVIDIVADPVPEGKIFVGWTGDTVHIADIDSTTTTLIMPDSDIILTAAFKDLPTYLLEVGHGIGGGSYLEGTVVNISANTPPEGKQFTTWTGDTSYLENADSVNTIMYMPAKDISISANFEDIPTYTLMVERGSGDGFYPEGTVVNISANKAPAGKKFSGWTGDIGYISNIDSINTTIKMPAADINITANYTDIITYYLTVGNGSGEGYYQEGDMINITADTPPENQQFKEWTGDIEYLSEVDNMTTVLTMPAANISITATYEIISSIGHKETNDKPLQELLVYPNPAVSGDILHLYTPGEGLIRIFDANGILVSEKQIKGNDLKFETSDFNRGIYMICFVSSSLKKMQITKIVIR